MAGLFSPGYPLGTEPCAGACHHHMPVQGVRSHHGHHSHSRDRCDAHPQFPVFKALESTQFEEEDEYSYDLHTDAADEDEFDPFLFIATLPAVSPLESQRVGLPKGIPPKPKSLPPVTLVLDLDETLVHCTTDPTEAATPDFIFDVNFNGTLYKVRVNKRPFFHEFIQFVSRLFEVVVFTASQRVYADKLLDILDPGRRFIHERAFRDSCVCVEGNFLKDLNVLGRDPARTIIVDNSPQAFAYNLDNGIPIVSWFDCNEDRELKKLMPFLAKLAVEDDVRPILRKRFRLREKVMSRYSAHRQKMGGFRP